MDASFLRALQRAIHDEPECAPWVHTNDMPQPTEMRPGLVVAEPEVWDGLQLVKKAVMKPGMVEVKLGAHRKDAKVAEILVAKGVQLSYPITEASVSRALRGPWGDEE